MQQTQCLKKQLQLVLMKSRLKAIIKVDFKVYEMHFKYFFNLFEKKSDDLFPSKHTVEPFRDLTELL